jgi:hypothetical protein
MAGGCVVFQVECQKKQQRNSVETASHSLLAQQLIQLRELRENISNTDHATTDTSNHSVFHSFLLDVVENSSVEIRRTRDGPPKAKRLAQKNREHKSLLRVSCFTW